jgi:hypothetical protein
MGESHRENVPSAAADLSRLPLPIRPRSSGDDLQAGLLGDR